MMTYLEERKLEVERSKYSKMLTVVPGPLRALWVSRNLGIW